MNPGVSDALRGEAQRAEEKLTVDDSSRIEKDPEAKQGGLRSQGPSGAHPEGEGGAILSVGQETEL